LAILDALLRAGALPWVFEFVDGVADERNETDALTEKLIMEDGGVFNYGD
jgi:hypothetical protein